MICESARHRPPPALRPLVAWYSGYRQAGLSPARHRGLPSPYLTLIVTLDDPLTVAAHPDPRQPASQHAVLVGGLHSTPALITHEGRQSGIQLQVTPAGARALLGVQAGQLAGLDLEADDVLGAFAAELHDRVRAAAGWAERFTVLDELLTRRAYGVRAPRPIGPGGGPRPEVAHAWRALLSSRGTVPIADLASQTGWTSRHLGARFRDEFGLSPKTAARVIRFDRARRLLQQRVAGGAAPALAELAAGGGFFDQAHLAREFRELAGCAPSRWLAEEFRNVQAAAPGRGKG